MASRKVLIDPSEGTTFAWKQFKEEKVGERKGITAHILSVKADDDKNIWFVLEFRKGSQKKYYPIAHDNGPDTLKSLVSSMLENIKFEDKPTIRQRLERWKEEG